MVCKKGNGQAEKVADRGNAEHVSAVSLTVAPWIENRQTTYQTSIGKLQQVISVVLQEEKEKGAREAR